MKVYVGIGDGWIAVPCRTEKAKISSLIDDALERSDISGEKLDRQFILTSADGKIFYNQKDYIADVLEDGQFLKLSDDKKPFLRINESSKEEPIFPMMNLLEETKKMSLKSNGKAEEVMVTLNGNSLTTETLYLLSNANTKIQISNEAMLRVSQSRKLLDEIVEQNRVVYGVTTGFGKFAQVTIPKNDLEDLQVNLIQSHCAGIGAPLSPGRTRMMLALRINILCKGYSGISCSNLKTLVKGFNASCLPWIPEKGTVGASGDLAPLAHMSLGFLGKGKMWSRESGWADAEHVLEAHGIEKLHLTPKEGLALINGTQFITALGAEAVERAKQIALQADVVTALTLEALQGTTRAFDEAIHLARPHRGQQAVASRLRELLKYGREPSEITMNHKNCNRVQDSYTLRCCPQVHGVVHDTVDFVKGIIDVELNSATDNPMILIDRGETISGGNFHGEYPSKTLDYLSIGIHELASISERRIERLCNPAYSELPAFLVKQGGLNSGYMMAHCTAAALVSENKVLCHPSSIDSLSTSAGQEDHVSMGGWSARKALRVVEHVEYVIAIELLCACQGIEFHRPLQTTEALEAVYRLVRSVAKPYDTDRVHSPDIEAVAELLRNNEIWKTVEAYINLPINRNHNSQKLSFSPTSSHAFSNIF